MFMHYEIYALLVCILIFGWERTCMRIRSSSMIWIIEKSTEAEPTYALMGVLLVYKLRCMKEKVTFS